MEKKDITVKDIRSHLARFRADMQRINSQFEQVLAQLDKSNFPLIAKEVVSNLIS